MWTYDAHKKTDQSDSVIVLIKEIGQSQEESNRDFLHHHEKHSPDGFQFGYNGSGPADLARSILIDFFIREKVFNEYIALLVEPIYQNFKHDFIVGPQNDLHITSDNIKNWIDGYKNKYLK